EVEAEEASADREIADEDDRRGGLLEDGDEPPLLLAELEGAVRLRLRDGRGAVAGDGALSLGDDERPGGETGRGEKTGEEMARETFHGSLVLGLELAFLPRGCPVAIRNRGGSGRPASNGPIARRHGKVGGIRRTVRRARARMRERSGSGPRVRRRRVPECGRRALRTDEAPGVLVEPPAGRGDVRDL